MFWSYFWEIVLGMIALFVALAMLSHRAVRSRWQRRSGRTTETITTSNGGNVHTLGSYLLPMFAWLPVWIIGHFFWQWLTGHESYGYPWYFHVLFWIAVVLMVVSLMPKISLQPVVKIIGYILVAIAIWNLGWFVSEGIDRWFSEHDGHLLWIALAIALLVFIMVRAHRGWVTVLCLFLILVLALLALVEIGAVDKFVNHQADGPSTSVNNPPPPPLTDEQNKDEAQKKVTVPTSLYEEATPRSVALAKSHGYKVVTVSGTQTPVFVYGSQKPVGNGGRLWSDAVNVPLKERTRAAEQAVVSVDPAQAAMVMNGLGRARVGDKTVFQLNPWMRAQGSPSAIGPRAARRTTSRRTSRAPRRCP
jgi:hypothetical protein